MLITGILSAPAVSFGGAPSFSPYVGTAGKAPTFAKTVESVTVFSDSIRTARTPRVNPSTAMYHSLAFPGWGQMNNGKKKKAALFFVAEVTCITGYIYMSDRVRHDDVTDWERANLRTDRNTFVMYWLGAKVLGLVDAYVDAHLADFDVEDITPKALGGQ